MWCKFGMQRGGVLFVCMQGDDGVFGGVDGLVEDERAGVVGVFVDG